MKKLLLVLVGALTVTGGLFAQQNLIMQNPSGGKFTFLSGDENASEFEFRTGNITSMQVITATGSAFIINTENGTPILQAGYPDLPKVTKAIIVPDAENMQIQVVDAEYTDYENVNVAPSKGTLIRTVDPSSVPYQYNEIYNNDVFYPFDLAHLGEPYIMRDFRAQSVTINPVQYNAQTKTLRVYTYLRLSITSSNTEAINPLVRNTAVADIDKEMDVMYKDRFINYGNHLRYTNVSDIGSMLIITDPAFESAMQPFVNWKIQRGLKTVMVTTTVAGTTSSDLKTYISNYYTTNPDLKYVLFVGDHAQVPAADPADYTLAGPSDNFYGYLTGNDHYPEIFIGRFSATTTADVNTMVQRSVEYEKNPLINAGFDKSVHIGSDQGPGDDGQMDFEHQRALLGDLLNFTYTAGDELYDGSQGGEDAAGNPVPQDVVNSLNEGRGIVTYTGHGWDQGFGTSSFSSSQVPDLTNVGMLPFIWSVACVNGNFTTGTCFAEALTRSQNASSQPTGAVATLMSTINQYWNEPMEGQDEMVHLLTLSSVDYNKKSFGALSMNGCMQMNDAYGQSGMDMTDTWTCFGDPSLMVRTATPTVLTANHVSTDLPGITFVNVSCNIEGAFVAITMNNVILGTGTVSGGHVNITIPAAVNGDVYTVTATAFNYVPHIGTVTISATAGVDENTLPGVSIYPNPASEFIAIHTTGTEIQTIRVFDVNGKEMYVYNNAFSTQFNIPVDGWAKGNYNVQLTGNGKTATYKVVVK